MSSSTPTPESLAEALRAADRESHTGRRRLLDEWGDRVGSGEWPADLLGEVALVLLATLTEEDGSLDMAAAALIRQFGGPTHLERLTALRPSLRPRKALRDWRHEVGRAISTLQARADGRCTCDAEAGHGVPVRTDGFTVEAERSDVPYTIDYEVRCDGCGRTWAVREEHGYHYPVFRWERR